MTFTMFRNKINILSTAANQSNETDKSSCDVRVANKVDMIWTGAIDIYHTRLTMLTLWFTCKVWMIFYYSPIAFDERVTFWF